MEDKPCEIQEGDNETLKNFMDWINKQNEWVLSEWNSVNLSSGDFTMDDSDLINSMVNVEESV